MMAVLERLVRFRQHFEKAADRMPGIRRIGGFCGDDHTGRPVAEFDFDYGDRRFQVTVKEIERADTLEEAG